VGGEREARYPEALGDRVQRRRRDREVDVGGDVALAVLEAEAGEDRAVTVADLGLADHLGPPRNARPERRFALDRADVRGVGDGHAGQARDLAG